MLRCPMRPRCLSCCPTVLRCGGWAARWAAEAPRLRLPYPLRCLDMHGLLSRCARNRLPGLAEAEQLGPAERPRSLIAETTAERTELRPINGGAPRPRCTRSGLGAPPWFRWESLPGPGGA